MPRHCEQPGCSFATRAGKPFCSEHVEEHPYISELLSKLSGRDAEEARVRALGASAIDLEGLTVEEILRFLGVHGDRSVPRLARDLNMDVETLQLYIDSLIERGVVVERDGRRKAQVIGLQEGAAPRWARAPLEEEEEPADPLTQG